MMATDCGSKNKRIRGSDTKTSSGDFFEMAETIRVHHEGEEGHEVMSVFVIRTLQVLRGDDRITIAALSKQELTTATTARLSKPYQSSARRHSGFQDVADS